MIDRKVAPILIAFVLFLGVVICYMVISVKIKREKYISTINKISKIPIQLAAFSPKGQPTIINIVSPTCEHCQYEAQEIRKHIKEFSDTKILMVSPDDSLSIKKFAADYQLDSLTNVQFLHLPKEEIFEKFGSASVPRILIYNQKGNLLKDFKGEVKIEKILEVIDNEKK